ncbi:UNVERIFIED_CONTAM: LEAF RUST 10 DISEASE-RESISTANCE LOCUS RECEPTOR-LIKE PROTEIN KINASE-like 2.1, partial [Sesamum angustifolium]
MNPKFNQELLPLILTIVLLIQLPSYSCQNDPLYQTCSQPFQCGSLGEIGYPFWGGNRPVSCGYPGFQINCQSNVPFLNISSTSYRVLQVDNTTQTLRVSREDLWGLFVQRAATNVPQPIQLQCEPIKQLEFLPGNGRIRAGNGFTCNSSIYVPEAIRSGFSIQWSANNNNCNGCARSGGLCGSNEGTAAFACYCADRVHELTCDDSRPGNGASLGIAVIVVSSIIILYTRKQFKLQEPDQENIDKFLLSHGSLAPKRYNYREIKKITNSFVEKLGRGGYGIVYKGKLPDGQLVAVKVLTETDNNAEEFINEVASISRTSHVNIVNLLGFCYDRKRRVLVYEYMPNKSLDKFICKGGSIDPGCRLERETLYGIAVGVARGLEYLHRGCNTRIVHFDIKPQNILLDEEFCPKISDFGLAKLFKKKQSIISMLGARGTIGYIAPEVFSRNFGAVSHKSDVYSYGMMLLEMAGARNFDKIEAIQSSEDYFPDKIYEHVVVKNEKLDDLITEEQEESARKMLLVGFWCIQTAPSDRPPMTKVVEMLEGSLQSYKIPPEPFLSSPKLSGPQFSSSVSVNVDIEISTQ